MSKWIGAAASVVFLVVIIGRLAQIERLLHVASQGIWYLLLVALLLQGLFLLNAGSPGWRGRGRSRGAPAGTWR